MAVIRIELRQNDGSSVLADTQDATPEQVESARELAIDITRMLALPEMTAAVDPKATTEAADETVAAE